MSYWFETKMPSCSSCFTKIYVAIIKQLEWECVTIWNQLIVENLKKHSLRSQSWRSLECYIKFWLKPPTYKHLECDKCDKWTYLFSNKQRNVKHPCYINEINFHLCGCWKYRNDSIVHKSLFRSDEEGFSCTRTLIRPKKFSIIDFRIGSSFLQCNVNEFSSQIHFFFDVDGLSPLDLSLYFHIILAAGFKHSLRHQLRQLL